MVSAVVLMHQRGSVFTATEVPDPVGQDGHVVIPDTRTDMFCCCVVNVLSAHSTYIHVYLPKDHLNLVVLFHFLTIVPRKSLRKQASLQNVARCRQLSARRLSHSQTATCLCTAASCVICLKCHHISFTQNRSI